MDDCEEGRTMPRLAQKLDEIAACLTRADANDAAVFERLHEQIEQLSELLVAAGEEALADGLGQYAEQAADCAAGGATDPADTLALLARAVEALQTMPLGDAPPAEAPPKKPATKAAKKPAKKTAKKATKKPAKNESPKKETDAPAKEEPAPEPVAEEPDENQSFLDPEMLAGFVAEAGEHLETADAELLNLESDPRNQESLGAVFRAFHTIKGVAGFMDLRKIASLAHEAESLLDQARNEKLVLADAALDAVFASVDVMKRLVAELAGGDVAGQNSPPDDTLALLLATLRNIGQGKEADPAALAAQKADAASQSAAENPAAAAVTSVSDTLKVDRNRLDRLVDMIGELVIAESMVQQELLALGERAARGGRSLSQLNKITRNLQELSLSLRMVPVRGTFQKMARLVRDLAKKVHKPIDFRINGEDTELDKNVVDQIGDPLVHMIRNAVDHGIETSVEERVAAGKEPRATVELRAFHQGGNIYIEIEDDGRGLDRERILAKAVQRGLIDQDAELSDREVYDLIFQPGFSTAEKLTDVSGRGVGMDVVRRNIEALRGSVELRSEPGRGTCFSMRLPLTLAIIDGMAVRVGGNRYILPTLSIVELLRPEAGDVRTVSDRGEFITVRERHLPLARLAELFGHDDANVEPTEGIIVVVEQGEAMFGLLVDEVLGQQQAVTKSLGHQLEGQPGLAGGAVMPDGKVGLILDIHGILQLVHGAT
jgi:two-component system chemotaxis sensor kinase CheA